MMFMIYNVSCFPFSGYRGCWGAGKTPINISENFGVLTME